MHLKACTHSVEKHEILSNIRKIFREIYYLVSTLIDKNIAFFQRCESNCVIHFHCTVWKFKDFSATQILREINFGLFEEPKTAI